MAHGGWENDGEMGTRSELGWPLEYMVGRLDDGDAFEWGLYHDILLMSDQ